MLLAPGTGSFAGAEQNTITDRLTRIALITYDSHIATLKFNLTQYQYMSDYSNAVGSMPWPNQASLTADLLSEAFKAAQEVLLNSARLYASRSVIVFSDDFSSSDYNDSIINYHLLKDVLDASVFGIYIGQSQSDSFDYRNFTDERIALPFSIVLNPTKPSAIKIANALRTFVCTASPPPPPPPTAPPTITTQAPCTYPPPPTPSTSAQPTKAPAGAWPDITILLDTSANLAAGSNALNDRGFEAVRMFLVNTLQQYRIDVNHTRVSLVTFDGTANVVFTFNQNLNMASLMNAIGNQWEYGPAGTHTADRNLNAALQMVLTSVYNEPSGSGYDPNHINFLWAFVTGNSTDSGYAQSLYQLQSMGIRTQAIGLGTLDQQFLSNFGFDSFDYASPFDPVSGIASPNSPLPHMLYQQTTVYITPPPTLAQVSADIVIVIEESTQLTPSNFTDVTRFLTQFFTHLQFGPAGSSVALFSYNNRSLLGWPLNSGNNKTVVLDITSKLSYQNSNISTPNINAALDSLYSIYLNASSGYQNRSTFVIFLTSSSTVSPDLDAGKALLVRQMANVFAIDIGGNNMTPEYFERLTGDVDHQGFSVSGPGALLNWINKPLINGTNPMNTFFQQMIMYQQNYVYNHPVPVTQIAADFIFAIDQTLLTQGNFTSIQNYLVNLTAQMTISPQYAQVGVLTYSGNSIANGSAIHLNSSSNYTQLRNAINGLPWTDSAGQTTSDIAAAYDFISNFMLTPAHSWRFGPTFVIVLSSAFNSTLYNGTYNNTEIQQLNSVAHTYGISLTGYGSQGFLTHYCRNTFKVSSPTALTVTSATSTNLISAIDSQYKTDRFPPLPPLSSVQADFIFVIDQSHEMFASDFAAIKTFLTTFVMMWDSQNIGINGSQLAVVSYNSNGILMQSSFALNSNTNKQDLSNAIGNLPPASSIQTDSDIATAIKYVNSYTLSAAQGRRWWKPVFVTFIGVAQNLTKPLDQSQIDMLNANSQTFGFDYFEYPTTFQYLAQITGNIDLVERISDFDFSKPGVQNYLAFVEYIWRDWSNSNSKRR
uniref:VWFA domain-containing protein n=1 Tax=Plectus sambesii TaxID=2011161 RepID=A0A914VUJ4_9BILA